MDDLALDYLENINRVKKRIEDLKIERSTEKSLELKNKLTIKIKNLEHVLMELQRTYSYVLNYYNKESPLKQWI